MAPDPDGNPLGRIHAEISDAMVRIYKKHFGKGPTRVRTHYTDDVITCVLRDGYTRSDTTLVEAGEGELVRRQRHALQEAVRHEFTAAIEKIVGRRVIGFFSGSQDDPVIEVEVFVLERDSDT